MSDDWQRLSEGSSRTQHTCRERGEKGCRGCRWFETRLDVRLQPEGAEYRISIIGRSIVPDEVDRFRTETTTSANAVVDYLAMGEPNSRYIPKISRQVLHEAADEDEAIGEALDDFDSMVRP